MGFTLSNLLIMETIFYTNHRAEAKLFLLVKVTSKQEGQLLNLLDTVPDKVLICSKMRDAHTVKGIYNNRPLK